MSFLSRPFIANFQCLFVFLLWTVLPVEAQPVFISELMTNNSAAIEDEDGDYPDWIELHNRTEEAVDLTGWHLTDDPENPVRWRLPELIVPPGAYLVVFASGKDRVEPQLHANFKLSSTGEYLALVQPDGITAAHEFTPAYPEQIEGYSYGLIPSNAGGEWLPGFFGNPTPGRANVAAVAGRVADTQFSVDRGFFSEPFVLEISSETEGAEIRYTTDFSEPASNRGTVYSAPIPIETTTVIRAAAFKEGHLPTNADTQTYIFPENVIRQPERLADWPAAWLEGSERFPADYQMDPEVTQDPRYRDEMEAALLDIPTISIVTDMANLFSPTQGLYNNTMREGVGWERPASVEWILPDGSEGFQVDAGLRIQGGASREPAKSPKHSFRLLFKSQYGPSKLRYRLFPEATATDEFDTIILRAGFNQSYIHHNTFLGDNRGRAQYVRDQWAKDTQQAMGHPAAHNNYAHLYLNGLYWGLYNPTERPSDSFAATYFGGEKEEYDVVNSGEAVDGDLSAWNQMFNLANGGLADPVRYRAMSETLDFDAFIDFMIINHYGGNMDWDSHNWYAFRRRAPGEKFYFFMWDSEFIFISLNDNRIDLNDDRRPGRLFTRLSENPEFRLKVADHLHRHFFNDGVLTMESIVARWNARSATIESAILGESARWGDYRRDVHQWGGPMELLTRDDQWTTERNRLLNSYFPNRGEIVLDQYRARDLYPGAVAPEFDLPSGRVESGTRLTMSAPSGAIYYTTDGTDPRNAEEGLDAGIMLVEESASKTIFIPQSANEAPPSNWIGGSEPFDDAGWTQASGGVGYDENTTYAPYIDVDVNDDMNGRNTSVFVRVPFQVGELSGLNGLSLNVRYDDGFDAYLNGTRVVSANAPASPGWNAEATDTHSDSAAVDLQPFDVSEFLSLLRPGVNVLAVQGLNASPTSSDFLISVELQARRQSDDALAPSAILYTGPIELAGLSRVNARTLDNNGWSALNSIAYAVGMEGLRLTELHYHPGAPTTEETAAGFDNPDLFEFIELRNLGESAVDLNGIRFTDGIEFEFADAAIRRLEPGALLVLVKDEAAFEFRYGEGLPVAGQYGGNLANQGERIAAVDAAGQSLFQFVYSDEAPWPEGADGEGPSLELMDGQTAYDDPTNWRLGVRPHGSPGTAAGVEVAIQSIEALDGQIRIMFQGPLGAGYRVYSCEDLGAGEWTLQESGVIESQDGSRSFVETLPDGVPQRYYRISIP